MSRRRRRSYAGGGYSPPPAKPAILAPQRRQIRYFNPYPVVPYRPPLGSRPSGLVHPAIRSTVRSLMRTVLTDTTPRRSTRDHLDVSRRAVSRKRSTRPPDSTLSSRWFGDATWTEPAPLQRSLTCARRSIRREVIFALNLNGKGSGAGRRRWTSQSKTRC